MNEQELRSLVREAIARHTRGPSGHMTFVPTPMVTRHASHGLFVLPEGADMEGPCIIEPAVMCNHCGYCKSYGH
jgi:hypothetical protein